MLSLKWEFLSTRFPPNHGSENIIEKGGRTNFRIKGNAIFWTWHGYYTHKLKRVVVPCTRPAWGKASQNPSTNGRCPPGLTLYWGTTGVKCCSGREREREHSFFFQMTTTNPHDLVDGPTYLCILRAVWTELNGLSETEKKHGMVAQVYNPATWNAEEIMGSRFAWDNSNTIGQLYIRVHSNCDCMHKVKPDKIPTQMGRKLWTHTH